ncbi:hypothetical protein [Arthrobacter sp. USHLN218]|uniref:hypothetical protein n=1 Tax=Arthrobacter sp. USHLN218 TaxID=3081232 RepID=UPI00301B4003
MAGKYEAEGTGLSDWVTRKNIYTAAIVVGAVVLAAAITFGLLTLEDVQSFIDLALRLVSILAGIAVLVTAALARANVEPPARTPER